MHVFSFHLFYHLSFLFSNGKLPHAVNCRVLKERYFEDKEVLFQLSIMHGSHAHGLSHNYVLVPLNTTHIRTFCCLSEIILFLQ